MQSFAVRLPGANRQTHFGFQRIQWSTQSPPSSTAAGIQNWMSVRIARARFFERESFSGVFIVSERKVSYFRVVRRCGRVLMQPCLNVLESFRAESDSEKHKRRALQLFPRLRQALPSARKRNGRCCLRNPLDSSPPWRCRWIARQSSSP